MDKLKQWVAITLVAVLGIAAAGWFLLISPKKSEAADLEAEATSQNEATQTLRNQIKSLQAQAKALPRERTKLAAVAAKLPADDSMPALIRALTNAADDSGLKFVSLTPGPAVAAVATTPVTSTAAAPTTADGVSTAPTTTTAATGLSTIPLTIQVFGGFYQVQAFLSELENLPRAIRVTGLNVAPGKDPGTQSATKQDDTDGQHLLTSITGEVFKASALSAATGTGSTTPVSAGAIGTAS